jgi:hypothetical protein
MSLFYVPVGARHLALWAVILIALPTALYLSACMKQPTELSYCEMHETDQSFVNNDKTDMERYEADREKRLQLIKANFESLVTYSMREGFPLVHPEDAVLDSCKYWAVTMTMIHTAQAQPDLFFSPEMSSFFKKEMNKGNIRRELLEQCLIIAFRTNSLSEANTAHVSTAAESWGIQLQR